MAVDYKTGQRISVKNDDKVKENTVDCPKTPYSTKRNEYQDNSTSKMSTHRRGELFHSQYLIRERHDFSRRRN
jgi:hypothetical protein